MMLYRVAADIEAGEPMPTGKNQWLQRNVWKLMTGEDLGQNPSGLAAKLMDFFASGAGLNMRAIYGAMKDIGPGVVDRWTWRSDGYITKTEKGEMMSSRVSGVRPSQKLGTTRGKAVAYEYSNTRLQLLTDLWNRERRFGRDDWTVDQIQAIDWFATKKEWVDNKWTPVTAEGGSPLDMAIHNTREVSFRGDAETLQRIVEEAGAGVSMFRGRRAGEEALTSTSEAGWTHAIVAGASKRSTRWSWRSGARGTPSSPSTPASSVAPPPSAHTRSTSLVTESRLPPMRCASRASSPETTRRSWSGARTATASTSGEGSARSRGLTPSGRSSGCRWRRAS